jgi:hypothetical protein
MKKCGVYFAFDFFESDFSLSILCFHSNSLALKSITPIWWVLRGPVFLGCFLKWSGMLQRYPSINRVLWFFISLHIPILGKTGSPLQVILHFKLMKWTVTVSLLLRQIELTREPYEFTIFRSIIWIAWVNLESKPILWSLNYWVSYYCRSL